ncbi:MAG: Gfo/Idh/MocA family oxidoreductase, partial [SAR202 cluster bacterium]|nr:Gfo/Idh/MocA family oxidoreductase [SAR202 cluster bacterium]
NVNTYTDHSELFKKEKLDAVIICTPPVIHYKIALEALSRNLHLFIEKPCTLERIKAQELSQLSNKKGLVNQVGYVNRFNDCFIKVKEYLDHNLIGNVIRFKSEMYSATILKSDSGSSWRDSRESGGGATIDMAAHAIDLVNYLIGKPDKITGSNLTKIFSSNVEDAVNATFLYSNGTTGILNVNWSDESYRKPTNKIEILGLDGKILADQHGIKLFRKTALAGNKLIAGWNTIYITDVFKSVPFYVRGNEFTSQLYHFIDCILDREKTSICTFKDASDTLEVIEGIFNDFDSNGRLI